MFDAKIMTAACDPRDGQYLTVVAVFPWQGLNEGS
jgi:hypothetical protein